MKRDILDSLTAARQERRPAVLATHLGSGASALYRPGVDTELQFAGQDLTADADAALAADRTRTVETPDGEVFLNIYNPPLRMLIIGAVHITQELAPMAARLGFDVTIIDPRGAFAEAERFEGLSVSTDWPDDALKASPPDARTAVITLTHDPKLDDAALLEALASPAFYIGSLGSRKTHGARLERLRRQGVDEEALERINGPVGLNIGATSPGEIAVSILAQVIETLRGGAKP